MALTRDALRNFYRDRAAYLNEVIGMGYNTWPEIYRSVLNGKTMSGGWTDIATISEFGLFVEKPELSDAADDDILEGPTARVAALTFAKQHKVSEEAIEDDEGDQIIANRVPALLRAAQATRETLAHEMFNGAFGVVKTPDGIALCDSSHVNLSGVLGSNFIGAAAGGAETGVDLSVSSLETAVTQLKTQTNDRNIPIMQMPSKLFVAPANEFNAMKILNSVTPPSAGASTSAPTGVNPVGSLGITLVVSPYLSDDDAWFLLADQHGLNWYDRSPVANYSDIDVVKKCMLVGASFRCAQAATDWRGIVGNSGA